MTALPALVIEKDHRLQKASDELLELRWHWTLDESNSDRVTFVEYARQVGVSDKAVANSANGWAAYLATDPNELVRPGQPQRPGDFVELAKLGAEKQQAVKAIAKNTGEAITTITTGKREEIADVVNTARERAITHGTTVEHEIDKAAEWREKTRQASKRETDEHKAKHTMRFVAIEGHIGVAMQRLRKILDEAEGVDFTGEEKELLVDSLAKLRALLNLIDMRIAGNTNVDWDSELQKLVN